MCTLISMITIPEWSLSIINGQKIIESSLILDGQPVGVVRTKTLMCLCVDECDVLRPGPRAVRCVRVGSHP